MTEKLIKPQFWIHLENIMLISFRMCSSTPMNHLIKYALFVLIRKAHLHKKMRSLGEKSYKTINNTKQGKMYVFKQSINNMTAGVNFYHRKTQVDMYR